MSQGNVKVLKRMHEAFNRRDVVDAVHCLHPEVEMYPGIQVPDEESVYVGRDGMREWFRNATEPWEAIAVECQELIECPGERILTVERWVFRGRDGIELEVELPNLFTFRDGLIVRIDGFTDRAAARDAAGRPG